MEGRNDIRIGSDINELDEMFLVLRYPYILLSEVILW